MVCLLAMVCCALWGSAFPCIKVGYRLFQIDSADTATQILFAGCRFTIAGIMVILFGSILQGRFLKAGKGDLPRIGKICLLQTVVQYFFFYVGLAHTTGVKGSIVEASNVFLAILVSSLIFHQEKLDQKNAAVYKENAADYEEKLQELDGQFRKVVENADSRLLIFGDRFPFRYLAEEYGLDYYAAFSGCASDTEPSAATMAFLINKVKEEKVPTVLKMELSNDNIAKAIAEATGTDVKVFYSCHNLTAQEFKDGETYLSMMEKNVETLKEVLNGWH